MSPLPTGRLRPFQPVSFGRYTLLTPLSTGGMGEIFLARLEGPSGFEKLCVIKKILPHLAAEPDFVDRFVHEAKVLVKLSHGSIAHVLEMGIHDDSPYIAIEFVDGKDLRKVAGRLRDRKERVPLTFSLYAMARVLDALAYAHRKRDEDDTDLMLVHRDISPQNVLISYEGEVKVIDFGLAKSALNAARTHPSLILGKFLYMSPEQARHQPVDRRSDLYSVGLCLYELIAGRHPFDDIPPGELMFVVSQPSIPPLRQVAKDCPGEVETAVMRALAVDPDVRFQTAEEFRAKLLSVLLELDPLAGAESTSRFMRTLFEAEYQNERKLLQSAREMAQRGPDAYAEATRRSTLSAFRAIGYDEPRETPAVGNLALDPVRDTPLAGHPALDPFATPPPRSPGLEDTAPRIERPGFEETRKLRIDEATRPHVEGLLDELFGANDRTQPAMRSPLSDRDKTQVAAKPPPSPRAFEKTSPGTLSPEAAAEAIDELEISQRPTLLIPALHPPEPYDPPPIAEISGITSGPKRSVGKRIFLLLLLVALGAGGFAGYTAYRGGRLDPWIARLPAPLRRLIPPRTPPPAPPPTPGAENPGAPAPAAKADGDDSDLLEPLAQAPAAISPGATPLQREWAQAEQAFEALRETTPCEAGDMAMLCVRFQAISADVQRAGPRGTLELLQRVRALRQEIAKKSGR